MNRWAAYAGEKKDEERYAQFWELSEQGEQRCSERFVVCLRDTEDSQTGENCSGQGVKDQRQRNEFLWHLWTEDDGTKLAEHTGLELRVFMVEWQSSVTPRFLTVRHGNRRTPTVTDYGREEERDRNFLPFWIS